MSENLGIERAIALIKGVLDDFPAIVVVTDHEGNPVYHNNEAERILGKDIEVMNVRCLLDTKTKTSGLGPNVECLNVEYEISYNDRWFKASVANTIWINEEPAKVVVGLDITRIKTSERRFKVSATTDAMTGLLNRQAGFDFLGKSIHDIKAGGPPFIVCYFDINDLKYTNDTFGHMEGDTYILSVVEVVKKAVRQSDVFARMGGDEFMIIFNDCPYDMADNIMCTVNARLAVVSAKSKSKELRYSISYGVLEVNSETSLDQEYILNAADSKMYCMKEEYRRTNKLPKR